MSALKQTVHRVLVRNAQLRSPIVWKWRGGESAGRAGSKKAKQKRGKPAEQQSPERQPHAVALQENAERDPELHVLCVLLQRHGVRLPLGALLFSGFAPFLLGLLRPCPPR